VSVPQSETVLETSPDVRSDRPTSAPPAFVAQLSERVQRTRSTIETASADGEDDLAEAHLSELESLLRLAEAHDVQLPDTAAYLAQRRAPATIDLTGARTPQQA
jgi:hypothetical protein